MMTADLLYTNRRNLAVAAAMAFLTLLIHLFTNGGYGYFRDELYMLACGEHLDWGYPDHPPLIALAAWFSRHVLGGSLPAIRFLPALAGAAKVILSGLIAMELGGGAFAVGLACLSVALAPAYLGIDTILTMNAFEPLFWMGCAYLALLAIRRDRPRLWLWVGVVAGLGLENKHSMAFFLAALAGGLLLSPQRKVFRSRWFWGGTAAAFLLFLPNLIWQYRHDWATLELLENVRRSGKNVSLGPLAFLAQQWQLMGPPSILVWGAGLWFLLRRYRFLGWTFLLVLGLMMALKGKNYYMAPAYPMLFAAGGVWWERRTASVWIRAAFTGLVTAGGVALALIMLPALPPEKYLAYQDALGLSIPKTEVEHVGPLPQLLGDMFGWPEMVEAVAGLYHSLPPNERGKTAILAGNYGEAGAIDFFGPQHGLPKAISAHQGYYLWGPRDATGDVLILLQWNRPSAEKYCQSVEDGPAIGHPYSMAEEHYTVLICRGLKTPLRELWPQLKHWN
jgi:hypothetical protein